MVALAAAVACGDSATGSDIPEPEGDAGQKDGGPGKDSSLPTSSSSSSSTGGPVDGGADTGLKSDGGLPTVSVASLEFGEVDCGKSGTAQKFTISNPSGATVTFASELVKAGASPFTLNPSSGSIPAGGSVEVTVTPKEVPVPSSTTANAIGDTLKLTIGPTNAQVDLKQTAHGASLQLLTNSGSDFGNVSVSAGAVTLPIQLANAGNQAAPITLTITKDASGDAAADVFTVVDTVANPNPTTASPGITPAQVAFAPSGVGSFTGKAHVTVGAGVALCSPAPGDITFSGKGTDGVIAISAAALSFGNPGVATTDCGTQALAQTIKVSNSSSSPILIKSAVLGKGTTLYQLSNGANLLKDQILNISVAAGGSQDILVTPKLVPQNNTSNPTGVDGIIDSLTLITNAPGDTDPHVIPLKQTARGAFVTRSTSTTIPLGTVAVGNTAAPQTFTWKNDGNVAINLTQSLSQGQQFAVTPTALALGAGAPATTTSVTFTPTSTGNFSDTINVVQKSGENVVLCQALPTTGLGVSGTGGTAQLVANNSATTSSIAFGGITCGTVAPASKVLKITNNGPAGNLSVALRKAISPFVLGTVPATIDANETVSVNVTPKPVGNDIGTISDQTDTIDVSMSGAGVASNTPAISLGYTPQGAIIAVSVKTVDFSNTTKVNQPSASKGITLTNNGNVAAPLTWATGTTKVAGAAATSPAVFSTTSSSITVQPGAANAQSTGVIFTPAANVAYEGGWTLASGAGAILCAPFPQGDTFVNGVVLLKGTGIP